MENRLNNLKFYYMRPATVTLQGKEVEVQILTTGSDYLDEIFAVDGIPINTDPGTLKYSLDATPSHAVDPDDSDDEYDGRYIRCFNGIRLCINTLYIPGKTISCIDDIFKGMEQVENEINYEVVQILEDAVRSFLERHYNETTKEIIKLDTMALVVKIYNDIAAFSLSFDGNMTQEIYSEKIWENYLETKTSEILERIDGISVEIADKRYKISEYLEFSKTFTTEGKLIIHITKDHVIYFKDISRVTVVENACIIKNIAEYAISGDLDLPLIKVLPSKNPYSNFSV